MKKPAIIFFDYAQTLLNEAQFNGTAGTEAVLKLAKKNPLNITATELLKFDGKLNQEIGRYNPNLEDKYLFEIHNHNFLKFLYDYFMLEFDLSFDELETIFWDNAAPCTLTPHIEELLKYLSESNIRTAVVSNISYSGNSLKNRLNKFLPHNNFEFVIASSEYVFRKPHPLIFELALRKANVSQSDAWFCGDSILCDVQGSNTANISAFWYTGAYYNRQNVIPPKSPHIEIDDWLKLVEFIKQSN
jgi:putative hydrolase of the HAD superfamily